MPLGRSATSTVAVSDLPGAANVAIDYPMSFVAAAMPASKFLLLRLYRENPALDVGAVAPADDPPSFLGRLVIPPLARSLITSAANDVPAAQPPDAPPGFLGRFVPPALFSLLGQRQNAATDLPAVIPLPDMPPSFVGKMAAGVITLFSALRQNVATDSPPPDNPQNFIGRMAPTTIRVLQLLRQNNVSKYIQIFMTAVSKLSSTTGSTNTTQESATTNMTAASAQTVVESEPQGQ